MSVLSYITKESALRLVDHLHKQGIRSATVKENDGKVVIEMDRAEADAAEYDRNMEITRTIVAAGGRLK